jgi:SNF2 family DNA or RNA helicase
MTSQLLLGNDTLIAVFPYDKSTVAAVKAIRGSKWDAAARAWLIPIDQSGSAQQLAIDLGWWIQPEVAKINVTTNTATAGLTISDDEKRIQLDFSWDPVKVRAVKQVPGVTWDKKTTGWVAPITSIAEAVDWADRFGLPISAETRELVNRNQQKTSTLIENSRRTDAPEISVAGLPLLNYQKAGVAYSVAARRCFIADDMGLGKTLQAIATLEYVKLNLEKLDKSVDPYPAVIVCPPTLVLNWAKEYEKWLPERKVATVKNRKDFPEPGYDVLVVGYSNIKAWESRLLKYQSYVFDESHYCKSPDAQRTKAAIKIAKSAPKDGLVLCLTGTPVTNRPAEYVPQLDILGKLSDFGGKWGFYRRHCNAFRDRFGQWNISGHSNLDELNEKLRGNCYVRRTKEQVLEELPPVRHSKVTVDGTAGGMKEYERAEADIVQYLVERAKQIAAELGESPKSAAVRAKMRAESNEHLVKIGVLRKLAARAKMPAVAEWVDSHLEAGKKVVIAAHHREIVDELASRYGNLKIQGGMDVTEVEAHKSRFQEGSVEEAPAIVLSIQAAKTGHTLTAAQDVLFVELPWTPSDVDQTYSRCHRLGQKGSVTATYLLCEGTIDEQIYNIIERKRDVVTAATEGEFVSKGAGNEVFDRYLKLSLGD